MNLKLAEAAKNAVYSGDFELEKGYCSRFVRQVVESVYNEKYSELFGASAIQTGKNFIGAAMTTTDKVEPGDILVKMTGSGGFGHIGIFVGDDKVAENSSTKFGRIRGALGFRTMSQWGDWQVTARIDEKIYYSLFYKTWNNYVATMPLVHDSSYIRVRTIGNVLKINVAWDDEKNMVIWDGKIINETPLFICNEAYLPLRSLIDSSKFKITVKETKVLITNKK
jgi:hypothetical protein